MSVVKRPGNNILPEDNPELALLAYELSVAISDFIDSPVFKKTKNSDKWKQGFKPFEEEFKKPIVTQNIQDEPSGGGSSRRSVRKRTKKIKCDKKNA